MRQFSAALAHELRTPLAVAPRARSSCRLRARARASAQRTAFGSQIEDIDRLTRLIDRILTLARAESGQIPLAFSPVDLGDLARSLVEQLEPRGRGARHPAACGRLDAGVVDGDAGWLRRLLLNLIDNALKFTGAGPGSRCGSRDRTRRRST